MEATENPDYPFRHGHGLWAKAGGYWDDGGYPDSHDLVEELPSAQPDQRTRKVRLVATKSFIYAWTPDSGLFAASSTEMRKAVQDDIIGDTIVEIPLLPARTWLEEMPIDQFMICMAKLAEASCWAAAWWLRGWSPGQTIIADRAPPDVAGARDGFCAALYWQNELARILSLLPKDEKEKS